MNLADLERKFASFTGKFLVSCYFPLKIGKAIKVLFSIFSITCNGRIEKVLFIPEELDFLTKWVR